MSLINETLHNLNSQKDEVLINPSTKVGKTEDKKSLKQVQNLLILFISFGIIISLFYISYHFQINQYFNQAKYYFTQHSTKLVTNASELKNKLTVVDKSVLNKDIHVTKEYSYKVQEQYYKAMSLLNEGNVEQARKGLSEILEENPDFMPAKQAISMLDSKL